MNKQPKPKELRCAVYTRKSTEEGLEQEFNSLDAQREAGEAYIRSMKHTGWALLTELYDDGGFTGGNAERPALKRLFADIESGKIDCVVVYKVDRLSRSLLDFSRMMETFERQGVAFVSVTQRFDTSDSMGRLTLNMLMSFAQFEREMISERTRDKIAATRRKGKWTGGIPLPGYDVVQSKLIVNAVEAERVRQIFQLYLEKGSIRSTLEELTRRGWKAKEWTTKAGTQRGGQPFIKSRLHHLLTNVAYIGKVRYKDEVCEGEHEAIVPRDIFEQVQQALQLKGHPGASGSRDKRGALLSGLLYCKNCDCVMSHTYTAKGKLRYRYYVCTHAQQHGWKNCPSPSVSAAEIERFVVDQIKGIGRDPELVAATLAEVRRQFDDATQTLKRERIALEGQLHDDESDLKSVTATSERIDIAQVGDLQNHICTTERRLSEVQQLIQDNLSLALTEAEVTRALTEFDSLWKALNPHEQVQILKLLLDRVEYDGQAGEVSVKFRASGWQAVSQRMPHKEDTAA